MLFDAEYINTSYSVHLSLLLLCISFSALLYLHIIANSIVIILLLCNVDQTVIYVYCIPKKHDHIFDNKSCSFKNFLAHLLVRLVYAIFRFFIFPPRLFSGATLLGKLSRPKYHEFSLKIFPVLPY